MVGQGLGNGPDMMREIGGAIGEVGGEEEGYGVDENGGDGCGDEQGGDDMSSYMASVSRKGMA